MMRDSSRRMRLWMQAAVVVVLLTAAVALIVWLGGLNTPTEYRKVTFKVTASGGYALVTYDAGEEKMDEATIITVPWQKTFTIARGTEVYLTAANPTQAGELNCSMTLDAGGRAWKFDEKKAPGDGVACAGIVP